MTHHSLVVAGGRAQAEFCIKYRMREVLEMMGLKAK